MSEALRGAGAALIDGAGRRFMFAVDRRGELAPRDVVARAIAELQAAGGRVYLDAREAPGEELPRRFPAIFASCRRQGLDPRREPLPVRPAAHYHMGGVATDTQGRTSLPGLWAAGEVACTGLHGANRLASNSLLECLVFGRRAGADAAAVAAHQPAPLFETEERVPAVAEGPGTQAIEERIRALLSEHVGVLRTGIGLTRACEALDGLAEEAEAAGPATRNLWAAARLVAGAARHRTASCGSHYRGDTSRPEGTGDLPAAVLASAPWRQVWQARPGGARGLGAIDWDDFRPLAPVERPLEVSR